MNRDASADKIYEVLYQMGLTANYTGFFQIVAAVQLSLETPQRLCLVTRWLYPDVARQCQTTAGAVERNIRTAIARIWSEDPDRLARIARTPLSRRPTNAQFLGLLVAYLSRVSPDQP